MNAVVELAEVSVIRGGRRLLDSVSLHVHEGERWVVLGPNGAGKTTLLSVLSTSIHPTEGVVGLLGDVVGTVDLFELRPRIGVTSSALADRFPPGERVADLVMSSAYAVVGRWREAYEELDHERARGLMREVGVSHLVDRTFATLSEGERKRVQIARALMTDPELLLLDEPAAGLDLGGREGLVSMLQALAENPSSPTTLMVSHHVEEIPPGFTHVLMMRDGSVVAQGPLEQTLTEGNLSDTFGLLLHLEHADGRWTARRRSRIRRRD